MDARRSEARRSEESLRAVRAHLAEMPLHRHLGVELLPTDPGHGHARLVVTEELANIVGVLHGGVIYTALDIAAYLATVPLLADDENAVTHDLHVSVIRPVSVGATVELHGEVRRRGRTLVFADAWAEVDGKLVASARVTKSIVAVPVA